jgi:hypothetical protein
MPSVAVNLPESLYRRLERLAEPMGRPVESLVVQALADSLPPLPDDLPVEVREALVSLETLDDERLWQMVRAMATPAQQERLIELQEKHRQSVATPAEEDERARLSQAADLVMLRKAYAAVLLKWRGHQLPTVAELADSA